MVKNISTRFLRFLGERKVYIYPAILLVLLVSLTIFRISGSSIGIYHSYFYGEKASDKNLLYGKPQPIRSDEWLVATQLTIAQEKNGFNVINSNYVNDKNLSLIVDVPYLDWSSIFKPHNLSFFVMPIENAFAFKWWVMLFVLMVSVYAFSLRILKGRLWLAILFSLVFSLAPFILWWYQLATTLMVAYGFLIMIVVMNIIDQRRLRLWPSKKPVELNWSRGLYAALLTYLLCCFALVLYPPFQIPLAIAIFFFLLGYLIDKRSNLTKRSLILTISSIIGAGVIAIGICALFLITRPAAVEAISGTVYPGDRSVATGGYDVKRLLVSYLQPQLQREGKGKSYVLNESESSTFILLPLFFLTPAVALLILSYRKTKRVSWTLVGVLVPITLFLGCLFVPGLDPIIRLFALHIVPHDRLLIGLGFLTLLLIIVATKLADSIRISPLSPLGIVLAVYSIAFGLLSLWAGLATAELYPNFISNKFAIAALLGVVMLGSYLLLIKRTVAGLIIIGLFTAASVFMIHPLYKGLGPIYNSQISNAITQVSSKEDTWAVAEEIFLENIPQMSGRQAITGTAVYPSNEFWDGNTEQKGDDVYNRYAHVLLTANDDAPLILIGPDLFAVSGTCSRKINQRIDYILTVSKFESSCRKLVKMISYPAKTFYIYQDMSTR